MLNIPVVPRSNRLLSLAGWLVLSFAAAAIGAVASVNAAEFYASLERPTWAPAARVFGPVWAVLYAMMGVAAWLVSRERTVRNSKAISAALYLFVAQLALNALWSWLFFKWHRGSLASKEIVILWIAIVFTIYAFFRISKLAGALLLPYLAWVSFATALTFTVTRLNPSLL